MALTSTPADLRMETVYWTAICSNRTRTVEECKTEMATTAARIRELNPDESFDPLTLVAPAISTVFFNRGKDDAFLEMMLTHDNAEVWRECLTIYINENKAALRDKYIALYIEKWGETKDLMMLKLAYLSMYDTYPQNVNEVERIITLLGAAAPSDAVTA